MVEDLVLAAALLFGGAAVLVLVLRTLLLRFAPRWLAGPGGLLIDTETRLGAFRMHRDHDRWSPPNAGGGPGCD